MTISRATFEAVVLEESDRKWELHHGRLREKSLASFGHNASCRNLILQLWNQVDQDDHDVLSNAGYLHSLDGGCFLPDVAIVPVALMTRFRRNPTEMEIYTKPIPFVAEAWLPRSMSYDFDVKFPSYRLRGDAEIWRVHPFRRTLTIWRRQPDGNYEESHYEGGTVQLHALPWVTIDVDALFVSG
jgi:Uma2 family endonuclease